VTEECRELQLSVGPRVGQVSALLARPANSRWLLVLGHGAGAGMRHHFLETLTGALAQVGVATLRYEFPYMERGRKRPDVPPVLEATVRAAAAAGGLLAEGLPLLAGGKSMGGRMTSRAHASRPLHGVVGLVFFGFPLHPVGEQGIERAEHLAGIHQPMLFLQGTRDRLADPTLLAGVLRGLGDRATLEELRDADHDFHMPARSGWTREETCRWLAERVVRWAEVVVPVPAGQPIDSQQDTR
jgi:hypothetical protein